MEESTILELEKRMEELEKKYLGMSSPIGKSTPFTAKSVAASKIKELAETSFAKEKPQITTRLPMLQPLNFNGTDLDDFFDEFSRWLRLSGVSFEDDTTKIDWLIEFTTPKIRPIVKKIAKEQSSLQGVLEAMAKVFPKMENDLTLRAKLEKTISLPHCPEPAQVAQMFIDLEEIFGKMSRGAMSDQEKFLLLMRKIHPRTFQEMRQDRFYKRKCENYEDLKESLFEKAEEDWQERHLVQLKKENVHTLVEDVSEKPTKDVQVPFHNSGKGKGKGKGGGQKFSRQNVEPPKFNASIQCKFCGRKGHYDTKCWDKFPDQRPKGWGTPPPQFGKTTTPSNSKGGWQKKKVGKVKGQNRKTSLKILKKERQKCSCCGVVPCLHRHM